MHYYVCEHCDNLECETSICPVCNQRTILKKVKIFYCECCQAPSYYSVCHKCNSTCVEIGSDLRPVFSEERLLLEVLLSKPFSLTNSSVWNVGANNYLINGKKVKMNFKDFRTHASQKVISDLNKYSIDNEKYVDNDFNNPFIKSFIECNIDRLNYISNEAVMYIKDAASTFDLSNIFVSFSGGKDSTVTSNLVMKALGTETILHIYGDTTLEYPMTKAYLNAFRQKYPKTPVLIAKNNDQDFNDLCKLIGPPSRVMRWCCTIFKTGAITKKIEQTFKDKTRILSFQGIRRAESISRSKYDRDTISPKITKQKVSSPIIDWLDFDVWLYILSNQIPFNDAYRKGFSRVGCWCCPNNSDWSEYLSSIYMSSEYINFHNLLYSVAKSLGKEDYIEYINTGKWKARQGGNGLEYSKNTIVEYKPCVLEEQSNNFTLSKKLTEQFYELFKPFGIVNFNIGNKRLGEVYVLSAITKEPIIKITGKLNSYDVKITIVKVLSPYKSGKELLELIKNQITKYQTCIGCTYCQSVCKFNALKVNNLEKGNIDKQNIYYSIDENKCVHCLECVKHFDGGCYIKKVLRVKRGN